MKLFAFLLTGALATTTAIADPLKKEYVAADAKWVVHLDVENLLATQLGGFVGRELIDKQLAKPLRDIKQQFDLDLDWRQIESVTAYGTDFQEAAKTNGVLIIHSQMDIPDLLDTFIDKLAAHVTEDKAPVRKVDDVGFPLYAAKEGVFGASARDGLFLLSRSKARLEKARQVVLGEGASLASSKSFPSLADTANGFLAAAVAEPFHQKMKLPPPAQGLKSAESGQVVAGEKGDRLFLNLALNTKDTESATQMQQVFQGLIAMAALSQGENQDLQKLVQSTKVGGSEKTVTVNLELPAADVIAKVSERQNRRKK